MGIFDRLGSVINSYLNDFNEQTSSRFGSSNSFNRSDFNRSDPDFNAAYEELNDYLNNKRTEKKQNPSTQGFEGPKLPPAELRSDFELLGVPFGANEETCKAAYKKLLKIHHPDRHAGHEGNYKKATQISARINAAWDRIEKWRQVKG
jgi:DnaJ-domain-containing protein 1